jgi:type IV pilus assembly protein PilY1
VYYNDLRPKIVDAKIFSEESACSFDIYADACIHPHGWGTLLISGMRFGGGEYPKSVTWDFDTDTAGWSFNDNTVSQTFTDGSWMIETSHGIGNPAIISPDNLEIDTSRIKTVEIRFLTTAVDAGAGGARLYWDIDGNGNFTEGSQTIDAPSVDTSGKYYIYKFDMSDNNDWSGIVKQIRIDPQGAFTAGSKVSIDYVDLGDGKGYVSSYVLMDVTNPERAPKTLAEINLLGLGYTTNFPTVVPLKSKTNANKNDWYLVFGSGINHNSLADPAALINADSNTKGKIFVLSLVDLISQRKIMMLDSDGDLHDIQQDGPQTFATLDEKSFISDMITVDFDLDYDADVVYFGTVSGSETDGWSGKLRRLLFNDGDINTAHWTGDSVFMSSLGTNKSITAAPTVGVDDLGNFWVYFGTGRFYTRDDINISDTQSYFGVKEPVNTDGDRTWTEVSITNLLNTTDAVIRDDKTVVGMGTLDTWDKLTGEIDTHKSGWTLDFSKPRERNLGQAALLGKILTYTTYQPSSDPCSTDGWSFGYGLYYKTGTAYYKSIFGFGFSDTNGNGKVDDGIGEKKIDAVFSIGAGLALSPSIHSGKEKGSKAFIQTSSGSIFTLSEDNPGLTKSSKTSWGQIE